MSDPTAISQALLTQIAASSVQPATANAQVVDVPSELQNLNISQTLVAQVVRQNTDSTLIVRADQGQITLSTSLTFEPGDTLSIRLEPGAPPQNALIRSLSEILQTPLALNQVNLDLPAPLSAVHILQAPSLAVTPLSQNSPIATQPLTEIITTLTQQAPVLPSQSAYESLAPLPLYFLPQADDAPALTAQLPIIETSVPLRTIAAQLPLHAPLVINDTPPPSAAIADFCF